uniref:NADH-ubiquinone oxidoreductase chain 5 n=1 Tax=Brycon orbignyanus TaxID=126315 RepID=A0A088Q769_9TELE|nr:NADH dehydrogenase subunit 5 [Brycon orbignyanus]AIN79136.1 NADH dehydrogenase subunit 5 [Brycon orbignyanus]ARS00871.1 NADH dehydrogenase subunit 5 [Brycon orbignyanus]
MESPLLSLIFLAVMVLLLTPLILSLTPFVKDYEVLDFAITAVKLAFFLSTTLTLLAWFQDTKITLSLMTWLKVETFQIPINLKLDQYSLLFMPTAFYVTWWILEYSKWYMHDDPMLPQFIKYLLLFLFAMIILVTADNMLQLLVGWEGVGMMSFLLIGWWWGRSDANTASLQAVLYNRLGDIGLIMSMAWFMYHLNSWDISSVHLLFKKCYSEIPLLGLILAAMGKSAQFGLHPWLPAAMEGPTPVSALLHSSTMVVAGIFLLIRFFPIMAEKPLILTICLCLGALTTFFSAACALTQNDLKKIVAFSTSSQLGLMMVSIGISAPQLALYHMCFHAFFKSMLFMCVGTISHTLQGEQDIRKMGGLFHLMPVTTSCLIIGCFSLMGAPFLSSFYSKDFIVETMNASSLNSYALALTLIAAGLTAVYSCRLMMFVLLAESRYHHPFSHHATETKINTKPLIQLAFATIYMGSIIHFLSPVYITPNLTFPFMTKIMIILITILGVLIASALLDMAQKQPHSIPTRLPQNYDNMEIYYRTVIHRSVSKFKFTFGELLGSQLLDKAWLQRLGLTGTFLTLTLLFKIMKHTLKTTMVFLILLIVMFVFVCTTYCLLNFSNSSSI